MEENISEIQLFLRDHPIGILSTHSVKVPGFPYGSMTPFCLDRLGYPIIFISEIAEHTKNIKENPKVSLTVAQDFSHKAQTMGRLTYLALATPCDPEEVSTRYFHYFPSFQDFYMAHGFLFYRLKAIQIRYIAGFGRMLWREGSAITVPSPFSEEEENSIIDHMNNDHPMALHHYLKNIKDISVPDSQEVHLVGLDSLGFHLGWDDQLQFFPFPERVHSSKEAKEAFIHLLQVERT